MTEATGPMTDPHEGWLDDVAAHALYALDAPDRARLDAHLRSCAACARRVEEHRSVVALLPYTLPLEVLPADLRAAILSRAWATPRTQASSPPQAAPRARTTAPLGIRFLRRVTWAAAALIIGALFLWNVELRQRLARIGEVPEIGRLARLPVGPVVELVGTGTPGASARLYVRADGQSGELAVAGLSPLRSDRVYQLWFARPGEPPVTGGPFRVNARGEAIASVTVPLPLSQARAIAIH